MRPETTEPPAEAAEPTAPGMLPLESFLPASPSFLPALWKLFSVLAIAVAPSVPYF